MCEYLLENLFTLADPLSSWEWYLFASVNIHFKGGRFIDDISERIKSLVFKRGFEETAQFERNYENSLIIWEYF